MIEQIEALFYRKVTERFFFGETVKQLKKIEPKIKDFSPRKRSLRKPLSPDVSKKRIALSKTLMGKG